MPCCRNKHPVAWNIVDIKNSIKSIVAYTGIQPKAGAGDLVLVATSHDN
jgi:hypothetical protein|tara:strand:+ start:210 stop:356 length:147 start_codon:yes stop_codon:yes gene_type:complete